MYTARAKQGHIICVYDLEFQGQLLYDLDLQGQLLRSDNSFYYFLRSQTLEMLESTPRSSLSCA